MRVFLVMCLSCCTRPTYSPFPVVMALAPIPTLMTQLYRHAPADLCVASASVVVSCIGELDRWMCSNQLILNTDKTDFILIGTRQQIENVNFHYLTRWHRRSFINYRDIPGSSHRQRADVLSPHQALDRKVGASTSFVSTVRRALSVEAAQLIGRKENC